MSKLSTTDIYTTIDELVEILARDVPHWKPIISKYKPLKILIATCLDNKQQPMFLPEQAVQLPIGELLVSYFNSTPYKVFLCLACLEEESELMENPCDQDETSGKSGKGKEKAKIKMELKTKFKSKSWSIIKVLF